MLVKIIIFLAITIIYGFFLYSPALLPRCTWCNKRKIRFLIRYIIHTKKDISYKGQKAVCKKCAEKYGVKSIADFEKRHTIKKKIEYEIKFI